MRRLPSHFTQNVGPEVNKTPMKVGKWTRLINPAQDKETKAKKEKPLHLWIPQMLKHKKKERNILLWRFPNFLNGAMNCLSWNCRELGNPQRVCELSDLVKEKAPKVIFLMETKKKKKSYLEKLRCRLKFDNLFIVPT